MNIVIAENQLSAKAVALVAVRCSRAGDIQLLSAVERHVPSVSSEGAVHAHAEEEIWVVDLHESQAEGVSDHRVLALEEGPDELTFVVPGRVIKTSPSTPVYE